MNLKFFLPIRTGTLDRERRRIERNHDLHMRHVRRLSREIAALQQQRNEHLASANAYNDAFLAIGVQDVALQIEHQAAE